VAKELRGFLDQVGWLDDKDLAKVQPKLEDFRDTHSAKSAEPVPITAELIGATGGAKSKYAGLAGKTGADLLEEKRIELDPSVVSDDPTGPAGTNALAVRWKGGKDPLLPTPTGAPAKPVEKKKAAPAKK